MPTHWTYEPFDPGADLFQGDILEPTEEIRAVFREVHPHFLDPKYTAFFLITQSCDLAIRKGRCNTRYLNIAVVRPLEAVLHDFLSHVCRPVVEGVYLQETKGEADRLLQRLFNQNEQALGLFYLHSDVDAGVATPSVALLRVTVTLHVDHYDVLREARRGRLCAEFRSKLGWLVGNLYSRIGTQDWSDPPKRDRELKTLVKQFIDAREDAAAPVWVPESWVSSAEEKGVDLKRIPKEDISSALEKHKPPTAKARAVDRAMGVLHEILPTIDDDTLSRISNRLLNDSQFAKAVGGAKSE